ncbi:MAG: topoisomerase IV [Oscillospiraceae bacterium]|nr:topoisomerase IV [Oscillospiraceae bacterium]
MAKKNEKIVPKRTNINAHIEGAGIVLDQPITETLEQNYMPYAMSVILSRAIPEIDGFKPAHRKILYTMYKMGLLTGAKTKSANIVGQTMRLNPHGDAAIYETMVRLSRGYQALLLPYVDSKGNFGKSYSKDMAYAASRYTEAKLDAVCAELFRDIDKDTVDFVPNYDNTTTEPTLLPTTFPSILVNANVGIAVGMASAICSFNLAEVCETTIALIKNPEHDVSETLKAPDFAGGGAVIYNKDELEKIYRTGRGSVKVRARYIFDKAQNLIEITEIPPTTTVEAIMDKIIELVKAGKIREIADIRDETDLSGLKLAIDLKRGVDADKLMAKLFKSTPLEDSYSCNFNILIGGMPKVMGVYEIISEWTAFRTECIKRRVFFELKKKKDKLHLLKGLSKILLDIDKAIRIVRETEEESEVVPNLMIGFGIDNIQAEYVAEIKLRHLNREYILNRTKEIEDLEKAIAEMEDILADQKKLRNIIVDELLDVIKKYGKPRKTLITYQVAEEFEEEAEQVPDYPVHIFLSREGYFKKIVPQSLRMSSEQKLKEGDEIIITTETTNSAELLFFTDKAQVYKCKASDFDDTKASVLGDYVPAKLSMDEGESVLFMVITKDYSGFMFFAFENGKTAKVPLSSYETKSNRKKLLGAYSDKSPVVAIFHKLEDCEIVLKSLGGKLLIINTAQIPEKKARDTQGVNTIIIKQSQRLVSAECFDENMLNNSHRFRAKNLPAAGAIPKSDDLATQIHF